MAALDRVKSIDCDCHELDHRIRIADWDGDAYLFEVLSTRSGGFWKRLKGVWAYLFGSDIVYAEVVVSNEKAQEIARMLKREEV